MYGDILLAASGDNKMTKAKARDGGESQKNMKKNILLFLILNLALGWLELADAQGPGKIWKVGVLASSSPSLNEARDEALRQGLKSRGYIEGQNLVIEYKYAEGKIERLPQLARELIEDKVDVIVVGGTRVALSAKKATSTIPIVVAGAGDLVESDSSKVSCIRAATSRGWRDCPPTSLTID